MTALVVMSGVAGVAAAQTDDSDSGGAMVSFDAQTAGGSTVTVDSVTLPDGGFVTIHDATLTDGETLGSVVGTSAYLDAGTHEDVTVSLTDTVDSGTYHAMAHQDTDGDRAYTFVSSNGEASAESDDRVVVQQDDGASGTFIVVGEGNVTVDDAGNVTAQLERDSKLVYRQYESERSESEKQQERMIANGTAAAEVYVQSAAESTADSGGDTATPTDTRTPTEADDDSDSDARNRTVDVVRYSDDTTVEVTERTESGVNMTVERAESEGRVVITSVSESVVESAEDVTVTVDGEAAAQADSYAEVRQATQGGESSKFLVQQSSSAEASYDVVVGINHFSERNVAVQDGLGSSSGEDGSDGQSTPDGSSGDGAGFGVGIGIVSLLGAALLARYRA